MAWMEPFEGSVEAHWTVTFAASDADDAHDRAVKLGEAVTPLFDTDYTRASMVRDPQGAALTLSEYHPPSRDPSVGSARSTRRALGPCVVLVEWSWLWLSGRPITVPC